ncbi:hypothetical protein, partial [Salmonella enterica]|uniref:hypothetical protein n=1 Tax=Salmonella enterica TaxID=28901 RepID=UPI003CF0DE6B
FSWQDRTGLEAEFNIKSWRRVPVGEGSEATGPAKEASPNLPGELIALAGQIEDLSEPSRLHVYKALSLLQLPPIGADDPSRLQFI